jgi:hypothetical protein
VDVTVQFFAGCPNWQTALDRIRLAANEIGVRVRVDKVEVETQHDAETLGFAGSPTILVDGRDPFGTPGVAPALACRVYTTPDGPAGAPAAAGRGWPLRKSEVRAQGPHRGTRSMGDTPASLDG